MLVSSALLLIMLSSVLPTFVIGKMNTISAKHRAEVRNILRAKVEEIKNMPYENVLSSGPSNLIINTGPDLVSDTSDDMLGEEVVNTIDGTGYKEVSVTISWTEPGFNNSRSISETLVTIVNIWSIYQ